MMRNKKQIKIIKANNKSSQINKININDSKDSSNFELLNNTSTKKSKIDEIALENFERNQDYDDDDNFNVVISGTLLKSKNNNPKENIDTTDKKEIKSSKNLSLVFSHLQESDIEKTKLSKNSDSENNLFSIESKDKLSFVVNNKEKNKNIIRIKTPNISQKSRSKNKAKNKSSKQNINLKKKK